MKTFFYQENTIDLFKLLKHQTPQRIFSNQFDRVVFDYVDFHVAASPDVFTAASQHEYDEVINADFQRINIAFQPNEDDLLLFENNAIKRLWILRTIIYFTDFTFFSSEAEALQGLDLTNKTDRVLADLILKTPGSYEQIVCHPQSKEAEGINKEFANLIDAGIMLEIDNKLLMCFSSHNGFGIIGRTMSPDEIKEDVTPFYEFIEVV